MFNVDDRITGYSIDEQPVAFSKVSQRKNVKKEDAINEFIENSHRKDCINAKKEVREIFTTYTLKFTDRIPFVIMVNNSSLEYNKRIVDMLESTTKRIKDKRKRTIKVRSAFIAIATISGIVLTKKFFDAVEKGNSYKSPEAIEYEENYNEMQKIKEAELERDAYLEEQRRENDIKANNLGVTIDRKNQESNEANVQLTEDIRKANLEQYMTNYNDMNISNENVDEQGFQLTK